MRTVKSVQYTFSQPLKSQKYKVLKSISNRDCSLTQVTKIMTMPYHQPLHWIQLEILTRLRVISKINQRGVLDNILNRHVLQAVVLEGKDYRTVYISKPFIVGFNLNQLLLKPQEFKRVFSGQKAIKDILLGIVGLFIAGGGHQNLIVTYQNIFFQQVGEGYAPVLNYFSFAGFEMVKHGKDVDRDEYMEIGLNLDLYCFEKGDMDRLEFKIRSFAILVLGIVFGKHPAQYVYAQTELRPTISKAQAHQYTRNLVPKRLKKLLESPQAVQKFNKFNISGLHQLIKDILCKQNSEINWQDVQKALLITKKQTKQDQKDTPQPQQQQTQSTIQETLNQNWLSLTQQQKQSLQRRILGCSSPSLSIYMSTLMTNHLNKLLSHKNWTQFRKSQQFSSASRNLFLRLMQESYDQKQIDITELALEMKQLYRVSFKRMDGEGGKYSLLANQARILNEYPL